MKTKSALSLLVLAAPLAYAGEAVDKTLEVRADGWVRIENVRGRIEVVGWEQNEVSVKGTLDDEAERLVFETDGASTTVNVVTPNHLKNGEGSKLIIHVPQTSRVRAQVVSAELTLTNLLGGVEAKTVSGDVLATGLAQRIELATVSGDIMLKQSKGATKLHSVSGEMQADVDAESLDIGTVSGDVQVHSKAVSSSIAFNSVSGDMLVEAQLGEGARVKGSSVSGDMRLAINPDADVVIDMDATASGEIKNGLTADVPAKGVGPGRRLKFTLGVGKGSIDLTSVSGTLELAPR